MLHFTELVSCGVVDGHLRRAPSCSHCQTAHGSSDNSNNEWCDGDCVFDDKENACKKIGKCKISFLRFTQKLYKMPILNFYALYLK